MRSRVFVVRAARLLGSPRALIASLGLTLLASPYASAAASPPPRGPDGVGGGEYVLPAAFDEITEQQRREIWDAIRTNIRMLEAKGQLTSPSLVHPLLAWPLAPWNGLSSYGYHGISNFVDQNPSFPNVVRDYNCGTRTYDNSGGYNHQGIDFFTWPFGWYKMDSSQVAAVAAAPGTIVFKSDGNFDRSCGFNNNNWNAVYVRHADNSIAWYGHLKNGSPTTKAVGQTVAVGEYLGIVGSSGNSTGPHLHLEVYDSAGALNEPYQGPCNVMNADSWWASQRPYYDSGLNHLTTGFAPPDPNTPCPSQESPNEQDVFNPGDYVYFDAYYRDQLSGQVSNYRVYQPDGSLWYEWTHSSPAAHYAASYWYFLDTAFAPSGPTGIWRFDVTFQSRTYRHYFAVGVTPSAGKVGNLALSKLPAGQVSVSWGASCLAGDTDYAVYEGRLGQFASHVPRTCTTGGALTRTLTPVSQPAGSGSYFLVAPANPMREGSLGTNSSGVERPQGSAPCRPQLVAGCP